MGAAYHIASRDYLKRAMDRLSDGSLESLFYAAFELRCGIESRMEEYLEVWEHIAEGKKKGWRIADLGKNIEREFRSGDNVVRWAVKDRETGALIICLYHTPVTRELRKLGEKLGNYMHSMKKLRPSEDPWWHMFRRELEQTVGTLRVANIGTLLGPPLMKTGTKKMNMNIEVLPGQDQSELMRKMIGQSVIVDVKYLPKLPDVLEPEASVWSNAS